MAGEFELASDRYIAHLEARQGAAPESRFYLDQLLKYLKSSTLSRAVEFEADTLPQRVTLIDLGNTSNETLPHAEKVSVDSEVLSSRVVVFEGHPAPLDLGYVGHRFKIPAEAYLGHLEFERVVIRDKTSYELSPLPSRRDHVVHIKLVRLGRGPRPIGQSRPPLPDRQDIKQKVDRYESALFHEQKYGCTRLRSVHGQTERYFIVEQLVTFSVVAQADGTWTAVVLLDRGSSFAQPPENLPWAAYGGMIDFLRAIDYGREQPYTKVPEEPQPHEIHPYHPWTDCQCPPTETTLLRSDPFYLLGKLYDVAALSMGQLLNFLEDDIQEQVDRPMGQSRESDLAAKQSEVAADQLRHNLAVLQRLLRSCQDNMYTIAQRGSNLWPRCNAEQESETMDKMQESLSRDHEALLERCKDLIRRCEVGSNTVQSQIAILEAQEARQQAKTVKQLTQLFSAFVPLSFVAAVFGMNVYEINKNEPPLWTFFLISIFLLISTYLYLFSPKEIAAEVWITIMRPAEKAHTRLSGLLGLKKA